MPPCCENQTPSQNAGRVIALLGNPNCGKTTLFNTLTGSKQRVGNWSGVTVERKSGYMTHQKQILEIVDLPGTYTLTLPEASALDERIACEFIAHQHANIVLNIVDASQLERHLYLSLQLLEMGRPVIIALNMMDMVKKEGKQIDIKRLSQALGCPVIPIVAHQQEGMNALKDAMIACQLSAPHQPAYFSKPMQKALAQIPAPHWQAIRLLEEDAYAQNGASPALLQKVKSVQQTLQQELTEDADILLADARYQFIETLLKDCTTQGQPKKTWTKRLDQIILNRFLGIPIFLGVMYALFVFSINIGGAFQDFFDISSQTIFVNGLAYILEQIHTPTWLIVIIANGIGKGINTTITFIPVIGAMFLFLAFLEDSGYMARAAFVVDRLMRALGLPGKAFVPMIVGFGCNVPSVMAARTLEHKRDRILTIMMSPFMSCGARLAIYAIFTAAFFPNQGANVIFALYLIGIFMAVVTGFLLRRTLLKGETSPLIMELPAYHVPRIKTLCLNAWQRLKGFVFRAGKLIVPICVLIGVLNTLNIDGTMNTGEGDTHSLLSLLGQWMTPIFSPLGLHDDNWPATVGLVTGVLAKEVVVGTLNTLYVQMGHLASDPAGSFHFWGGLKHAFQTIPDNLMLLGNAFRNPILAKAPISDVTQGVYGLMYQKFDGQVGAFAYLLFVLLYFPCISTTAAMLRELHKGWSVFSVFWTTGIAYAVAVIFYQTATCLQHPVSSSLWIGAMMSFFILSFLSIRWVANNRFSYAKPRTVLQGEQV